MGGRTRLVARDRQRTDWNVAACRARDHRDASIEEGSNAGYLEMVSKARG